MKKRSKVGGRRDRRIFTHTARKVAAENIPGYVNYRGGMRR